MKMFVYAVVNHEKVFLGVFENPETIYEDVEDKLESLGFESWAHKHPIYMMGDQRESYRLLWEDEK